MNKISIVIPTYNRADLLKQCLESILIQDYSASKYQLIIVNDGSTDDTEKNVDHIRSARDNEILYIRQENLGHSVARRKGFLAAQGDIIVSLDDDCIPWAGWLEAIDKFFKDNVDIAICCGMVLNATDTEISWAQHIIDYSLWVGKKNKKGIRLVPTGNTAYRREVIAEGILRDDGKEFGYRDIMFNYDIIKKGNTAAYNPSMKVTHHKWNTDFHYIDDMKKQFLNGQKRHGKGLLEEGYKVYGSYGELLTRIPVWVYVSVKLCLLMARACSAGLGRQFMSSFRQILQGLICQAGAFKNKQNND